MPENVRGFLSTNGKGGSPVDVILETKDLTKLFGDHLVINQLNLKIMKGRFTSIIGPNGAGKTTLFNLLSGQYAPTNGAIYFQGNDITRLSVSSRTRLGMGRSFQLTNIFPELTTIENIRLAIQAARKDFYRLFPSRKKYRMQLKEAEKLLEQVYLHGKGDVLAKNLPHGDKRKLEIAMILALKPKLLLLDEPTAGISIEEVPAVLSVIEDLKNDPDLTIVLIEHKMDMVLHLSDHVVVLFNGELLAEGKPNEIMENERVQRAYLGGTAFAKSG